MDTILAIDVGTSSVSAALLCPPDWAPLGAAAIPNDATVPGLPCGRHEQAPERLWELCCRACRQALAEAGNEDARTPRGIAITGQMHGVMLLDPGTLIPATRLITWRDRRAAGVADRRGIERTGCALHPGYGARTLAWLLADCPRICEGAVAASAAGFVAARLTGICATDETHAASWGLLDLGSRALDKPRLQALGIPERLIPPVVPAACRIGTVTAQAAQMIGVPVGTQVFSPAGDNQASVAGAAAMDPAAAVVNIGTGGQVSLPTDEPTAHPPLEIRPLPQRDFLQVGATLCAGWAYAYLKDFFRAVLRDIGDLVLSDEVVYRRMNAFLAEMPQDTECQPHWVTRFDGSRADPDSRASISRIDTTNLTPQYLTAACVQGIVDELAELARAADLTRIRRVVVTGTAARRIPGLVDRVGAAMGGLPAVGHDGEWDAVRGAALLAARTL